MAGYPVPPPAVRRPYDVLGIVAVCLGGIALIPGLLVFLVGLIPSMNAIWWLGIILIPLLGIAGAVVIALGVIGVIVAVRRGAPPAFSITGIVLGVILVAPIALLWFGSTV